MKRIFLLAACAASLSAFATDYTAPALDGADDEKNDSTGFVFKDIKLVKTGPVRDQNKSGTCWCFCTTTFLEDEVMRKGGPEVDLSEMFTVRHAYQDKARKYAMMDGKINFAQGGAAADVIYVLRNYGIVPESVYSGLNYGEAKHSHYELADGLQGYLDGVMKGGKKKMSTAWQKGFNGILDAYFGELPTEFTVDGKKYTPQSYAKALGLNPDDYINITSFTHHPFYQPFALEVADNWLWDQSQNVPIDELQAIVDNAIENGYTVVWAADVSEGGFKWKDGVALMPEVKTGDNLEGSELARWVKLSDKERENSTYDFHGPVKEMTVTQENRQEMFDNKQTTDDHGMVIVGIAEDQEGNKYYKVKNSWDTNQIYDGFFYCSVPYFRAKTMSIMVNKESVPEKIAKKIGIAPAKGKKK